jgi:hypothetical protein
MSSYHRSFRERRFIIRTCPQCRMFSRYVPLLVSFTSTRLDGLKSSLVRGRGKLIDLVFRSDKVARILESTASRELSLWSVAAGHSRHDESRVSYGHLGQLERVRRTLWITHLPLPPSQLQSWPKMCLCNPPSKDSNLDSDTPSICPHWQGQPGQCQASSAGLGAARWQRSSLRPSDSDSWRGGSSIVVMVSRRRPREYELDGRRIPVCSMVSGSIGSLDHRQSLLYTPIRSSVSYLALHCLLSLPSLYHTVWYIWVRLCVCPNTHLRFHLCVSASSSLRYIPRGRKGA